jgi:hypothetical protein
MKKCLIHYRQEIIDDIEKELKEVLKSNYKDHITLRQLDGGESSITSKVTELEQPVYMSIQGVESGKPKW